MNLNDMKKVLILLFLIFLLVQSLFSQKAIFAQNSTQSAAAEKQTVSYELPYPGILPDNPLYPLKAIRDRIIQFLIADPLRKAEFYLLNSDKRLAAGAQLIGKHKDELAISTISKSNNYFDQAMSFLDQEKKRGRDVSQIFSRMLLSSKKHNQVLKDLERKVEKKLRSRLTEEEKRFEAIQKSLERIAR